jgi:hypothetical protein
MGAVISRNVIAPLPIESNRIQSPALASIDITSIPLQQPVNDKFESAVDAILDKMDFDLHLAAKLGDEHEVVCLLLEKRNPLQRDDFDNIPMYYCSLYGHARCYAWFFISIGGIKQLDENEVDRQYMNALNDDIKKIIRLSVSPRGIFQLSLF